MNELDWRTCLSMTLNEAVILAIVPPACQCRKSISAHCEIKVVYRLLMHKLYTQIHVDLTFLSFLA